MSLDDILWDFSNTLHNSGIPNFIHWDFERLVEILYDHPEYSKGFYKPQIDFTKTPISITLIPGYK